MIDTKVSNHFPVVTIHTLSGYTYVDIYASSRGRSAVRCICRHAAKASGPPALHPLIPYPRMGSRLPLGHLSNRNTSSRVDSTSPYLSRHFVFSPRKPLPGSPRHASFPGNCAKTPPELVGVACSPGTDKPPSVRRKCVCVG